MDAHSVAFMKVTKEECLKERRWGGRRREQELET